MTTHNQNTLILRMRDVLREIAEHEHPVGVDSYCNDRYAYAGEHMVHVLRILDEAQAEIDELVKRGSALAADAEKLLGEYQPVIDESGARLGFAVEVGAEWEPLFRRVPTADVSDGRVLPAEKS